MKPAVSAANSAELGYRLAPLSRNWRFQVFWSGAAASMVGLRIAGLAYPLLILTITRSPGDAGAFGAVQTAAMVVFAMPGGAVADRADRRVVLMSALGVQAAAVASVPIALHYDMLTLGQLMAVAALLGAATAFGGPVRMLALRSLVAPEQLSQALVQEEVRTSGGALLGAPLAGLLYGLGRGVPFLATTCGCLLAVASVLIVRFDGRSHRADPGRAATGRGAGGMLVGLRLLWTTPLLRAILALIATSALIDAATSLIVVVKLHQRGASSLAIGLVMAGVAVGGILGALATRRLHRLPPGALLLGVSCFSVPFLLCLATPVGPAGTFVLLVGLNVGKPALTVMLDILIFRRVPDEMRGRVIAATVTALGTAVPVGSGLAGLLLQYLSPGATMCAFASILACALLSAASRRQLRTAQWPAEGKNQK